MSSPGSTPGPGRYQSPYSGGMTTSEPGLNRSVAIVTLGCARNDVDSEEIAARLEAHGWRLVDDAADAAVAVVNTCGFIESAKKDSIDAVLEAADLKGEGRTRAVVAVGCLAERYGTQLATELPEADAVLGFDSYPDLAEHLGSLLAGGSVPAHLPVDRRTLLPISPVARSGPAATLSAAGAIPGHTTQRRRLDSRPWAPLKIGSGCDRRCSFCAIPSFRGSSVSRPPQDVLAEAHWLAEQGVREVLLVSENTTSYGKDLADRTALESLLPELARVPGLARTRVSYLQPAEIRPGLIEVMTQTTGVVPYFDISFQHASAALLRRMNRFGSSEDFLTLVERIRTRCPQAGIRSNVIVGFPGETDRDVDELAAFLTQARLDAVGVFGYSAEDGTAAASFADQVPADLITERLSRIQDLVEELTAQRAQDRLAERVSVLVEEVDAADGTAIGRCAAQGPEVDGACQLLPADEKTWQVGDLVPAVVVGSDGVDLIVEAA